MSERVVFVREQGQTEYDIMYLSETVKGTDGTEHLLTIEELHSTIKEALGKPGEISKIILDDITIKNAHGIRFLFKKPDPKIEISFESLGPSSGYNNPNMESRSGGYSNFQSSIIPVSLPINQSRDSNNKWLTVLDKTPFSFGHSGLTINEHLFVFGGFADEQTVNHCLLLSETRGGGKFSKLKVRGDIPPIRERHSASIIGKKVYIFGGYCRGAELYYNTLYVFESETLTWTQIEARGNIPERRCGHSASVVDGKIWIFGGRTKTKKSLLFDSEGTGVIYKNDLYCYDPTANEWYRYEPRGIGPSGRALHASAVVGRKIYIFGGANSSGHGNDTSGFCDLYELDIDAMCWTECETHNTPPSPCYGTTATYIGEDRILFFGGKGYQVLNDIHILHLKTMEWKQYAYAGNTLVPRWGHSATLHDSRILIYGGRSDTGYYNSIDIIDISTELIELKPEEQLKEKLKRKQEEKNKTREVIGNLQNSVSEISDMITQLGTQLVAQKKAIVETRNAMIQLRQENEILKQQLHELDTLPGNTLSHLPSQIQLPGTPIFQTQNN
jgi:N-acetylneuraminic acid mutarotase